MLRFCPKRLCLQHVVRYIKFPLKGVFFWRKQCIVYGRSCMWDGELKSWSYWYIVNVVGCFITVYHEANNLTSRVSHRLWRVKIMRAGNAKNTRNSNLVLHLFSLVSIFYHFWCIFWALLESSQKRPGKSFPGNFPEIKCLVLGLAILVIWDFFPP